MELNQLSRKLIRAARFSPPEETVPYGFENRVLARLKAAVPADAWALWSTALWRAALACLLLSVLSGAWTLWSGPRPTEVEFSVEFEQALATPEQPAEEFW